MRDSRLILVADDEKAMRESLVLLLEGLGYRAEGVADGKEALEAVGKKAYDAILSDVDMPELDGIGLYERLCDVAPGLRDRFVIITADPNLIPEDMTCPILQKPFKMANLSHALKTVLGA